MIRRTFFTRLAQVVGAFSMAKFMPAKDFIQIDRDKVLKVEYEPPIFRVGDVVREKKPFWRLPKETHMMVHKVIPFATGMTLLECEFLTTEFLAGVRYEGEINDSYGRWYLYRDMFDAAEVEKVWYGFHYVPDPEG